MRALLLLVLFVFGSTAFADKYNVDMQHTNVAFTVPHLVVSKVKGRFDKFEGSFDFDEKSQKLDNVVVTIEANSINTNEKDRDKHLRSPDFFDVAKYKTLQFKSTKTIYEAAKPKKLEGTLTIRGVTKPVTLDIEYKGAVTDPWGNRHIAFEASTKINRQDYNLKWNKALEAGGFVVGDDVKIDIDGEAMVANAKK
ncbi:MAG TPA: YceI family protein [Bdellovibrio sp.]|uniref:YceI family protein n=1 Tax=Bdellovibrio sp. TaxID=28201 RepID=UPI002EED8F7E